MKNEKSWAIKVDNLSKTFFIKDDKKLTLRSLFVNLLHQGKVKKFKALDKVSFEIKQGEFFGIIGPNGCGKSTLLKILSGIYYPDKGSSIKINGNLVPFLELGVGFNSELSGYENIFLNGTILGMTRKYIKSKLKDIIEFAELEEFIETPVKNYSSGMILRLAFSIAIQADAEIYILDEILAVGDENFQKKCLNVIKHLKNQGKTVIFVSHSMDSIEKLCDRAMYLQNGKDIMTGKPADVVYEYRLKNNQVSEDYKDENNKGQFLGNQKIKLTKVEFIDDFGKKVNQFSRGENIIVRMNYEIKGKDLDLKNAHFGFAFFNEYDQFFFGSNTYNAQIKFSFKDKGLVEFKVPLKYFLDGTYMLTVAVFDKFTVENYDYHNKLYSFSVNTKTKDYGIVSLPVSWTLS